MKAATYARFSTDRQDARSIDDQLRRCRAFAATRGYQIVADYSDAAVSGTHTDRRDLQRLIADATAKQFQVLLVDDLSRLSRDLGDVWNLVFNKFALLGVTVVDVTTGIGSDSTSARMVFGTMGLVSDVFIQMIRHETHRGLEGRALAGFATGGRTYGFSTVVEKNPPDPEHPRKLRVLEPDEAGVVLRIFESFADGMSLKGIAAMLNEEKIAAPHDGGRGNKHARGWVHSTIRHMLRNENFIGVWVWNKTKWMQVPGTNRYKPLARPESEHVRKEIPELRIVPQELWERVQEKIGRRKNVKSRPAGTGKLGSSLLSGLLRCGPCGGSFVVVSRRHKNGVGYANFGCATYRSRGSSVCGNGRTISEKKLADAVVGELRKQLTRPNLVDKFVASFTEQFDKTLRGESEELRVLQRHVEGAELRVRNLTEALGRMGFSEAVANQLRIEEQNVAEAKAKLAAATREGRPKKVVPHPSVVKSYVTNLLAVLEGDKARAREMLARHMPPVVLTPEANGYRVTGGFNLAISLEDEAAAPARVAAAGARRSMISGVGGTGIEPATRAV